MNRIAYIDYLKAIGLLCIILAHVCTDQNIFQLRNFDVPLMVVISGFLAFDSYKRSMEKEKLFSYYVKRIKRLLLPTWIFLSIFFIIIYLTSSGTYPFTLNEIIRSYLLLDGIGYVWIIRIFILCALLTPILYYLNERIESKRKKIISLIAIYIFYEALVYFHIWEMNFFLNYVIAYAIPYGIIYILGISSNKNSPIKDLKISFGFLIIFIISMILVYLSFGSVLATQIMKYPPTIYYISYALFVSFLLLGLLKKIDPKPNKLIKFCSESSLWIYFWHILLVYLLTLNFIDFGWILNFIFVSSGACLITYVQNRIIDQLEKNHGKNEFLKLFRG